MDPESLKVASVSHREQKCSSLDAARAHKRITSSVAILLQEKWAKFRLLAKVISLIFLAANFSILFQRDSATLFVFANKLQKSEKCLFFLILCATVVCCFCFAVNAFASFTRKKQNLFFFACDDWSWPKSHDRRKKYGIRNEKCWINRDTRRERNENTQNSPSFSHFSRLSQTFMNVIWDAAHNTLDASLILCRTQKIYGLG